MNPPLPLAVVVVNWNTCALLRQCLAALTPDAAPIARSHVICVDNGSSDGSAAMVRAEFPAVALIANADNRGFAAAANQGITLALEERRADYVALVNSDLIAPPRAVASLVAHLEADPTIAAIGPALRLADDRLQRGAAGYPLTAWSGVCQFLFLSALSGGRLRGFFLDSDRFTRTAEPVAVDWVSGACMVVRADAIRRVGLLDERLFMYGEDVDWCLRMRRQGFAVRYAPATEVVHRQGASAPAASPRWLQSACEIVRRERGITEYVVFRTAAALGLAIRQLGYRLAYLASRHERYRRLAADMGVYVAWALGRR